jgi:hypothetical protein
LLLQRLDVLKNIILAQGGFVKYSDDFYICDQLSKPNVRLSGVSCRDCWHETRLASVAGF